MIEKAENHAINVDLSKMIINTVEERSDNRPKTSRSFDSKYYVCQKDPLSYGFVMGGDIGFYMLMNGL